MPLIDALRYVWPKCSKETREEMLLVLREALAYRLQKEAEELARPNLEDIKAHYDEEIAKIEERFRDAQIGCAYRFTAIWDLNARCQEIGAKQGYDREEVRRTVFGVTYIPPFDAPPLAHVR